jgi:hypothetical protein
MNTTHAMITMLLSMQLVVAQKARYTLALPTPHAQADHTVAVSEGGGACGLENLRTLCTPCHKKETAALRERLKKTSRAAAGTVHIPNESHMCAHAHVR